MALKAPAKSKDGFSRLVKIMAQLRSRQGCPWDRKQSHKSLKPYLIEEAYEVLEAIDSGDPGKLRGELGDLLLQAVFHAQVASERKRGSFNIQDVANAISDKLVSRHPHVYGSSSRLRSASQQSKRWEEIKLKEKEHAGRKSMVDGVPAAMPALLRANRVLSKAAKARFQWNSKAQAWSKFEEELKEFKAAARSGHAAHKEEELGDVLMAFVNVARFEGLDAEHALHQGVKKLSRRIQGVEALATADSKEASRLSLNEMLAYWKAVKRAEPKGPGGAGKKRKNKSR
jgi:tetrapyrrole methylase family protein/MazG family protein